MTTMKTSKTDDDKEWTIWLVPDAGELFLGLPVPSGEPTKRYCVLCKMIEESVAGVGVWVEVTEV
jgi:hypothetical protein